MSAELKPCPFCLGKAEVRVPDPDKDGYAIHVACRCGALLYGTHRHFSSREEASAAWNARAELDRKGEEG